MLKSHDAHSAPVRLNVTAFRCDKSYGLTFEVLARARRAIVTLGVEGSRPPRVELTVIKQFLCDCCLGGS